MLRIECPYCGIRDQGEFRFGGEANIHRPSDPAQASDGEWADYLFYRDNLKGLHTERWVHSYGCRRWFRVLRDTATHEIVSVHHLQTDRGPLPGSGPT
jgi:heterotetrameric sarcosine oxidase delta subunit